MYKSVCSLSKEVGIQHLGKEVHTSRDIMTSTHSSASVTKSIQPWAAAARTGAIKPLAGCLLAVSSDL
jgi:hypothetical protein